MNKETNDFLLENLDEAHESFIHILKEMKENNIDVDYHELETKERENYQSIVNEINQMGYYVSEATTLREENSDLFDYEYTLYIKYAILFGVSLAFIKLFHVIFDTSRLDDIVKYGVGMLFGGTYIGLLNKDIHDNRSCTKEKRDLINKLKTFKENYKISHDKAVCNIDGIFSLNGFLWDKIEEEKVKKKELI